MIVRNWIVENRSYSFECDYRIELAREYVYGKPWKIE